MPYTNADLEVVRRARVSGTKVVQFGDQRIELRSDEELAQLEKDILAALAVSGESGAGKRVTQIYPYQRDRGY